MLFWYFSLYVVVTSVAPDYFGQAVPKLMLKYTYCSSAVMVRLQVWKLASRSKGGPFTVTLETSCGLWSYVVVCCLPDSSLYDRIGRGCGEGGSES